MTKRIDLRLPDDLHARLVAVAGRQRRSLNAQILYYLEFGVSDDEGGGAGRAIDRAQKRAAEDPRETPEHRLAAGLSIQQLDELENDLRKQNP